MSQKVQSRDKVITKYSRDGLTEQNLVDKSEKVISDKKTDFELKRNKVSEEDMRQRQSDTQVTRSKPKQSKAAISGFNIITGEKATPYNVLADTPKSTVFAQAEADIFDSHILPIKRQIIEQKTTENKRDIKQQNKTRQDTLDKRVIPDNKDTSDKLLRYRYSDKPKKEYTRQEPKANNFKKRQRKAVVNEHMKTGALHNEQSNLKFTDDKGQLKFNEGNQKLHTDKIVDGGLQFKDTEDESESSDDTVKATQNAAFYTANTAARNIRGTLKQKQQRLFFEKSQRINSDDIQEVTNTLQSEQDTEDSSGASSSAPERGINKNRISQHSQNKSVSENSERRSKLKFDDTDINKDETALVSVNKKTEEKATEKPRSYLKAEKKADRAMERLKQAESRQPTRKVLKAEQVYDDKAGKSKTRLRFDDEKKPPSNPHFIIEAPKQTIGTGAAAVAGKIHQKLYQSEHDNSAVKAAHRTELVVEDGVKKSVRYAINRHRDKPYRLQRKVDKLKNKADRANRRLLFEKAKHENPGLQKKLNKKTQQKRYIKKNYQKQMRKQAQKKTAKKAAEKTARILKELVTVKNKGCAVIALIAIILAIVACSLFASVITSMIGGFGDEYLSSNEEVGNVISAWQGMEDDIQSQIDNAESDFPDYNRYIYTVETERADRQKLLAYLSTKNHSIVYTDCQTEVQDLFNQVYELSFEEYINGDYKELNIKLHVNNLDDIIDRNLTTDEERQAYGAYLEIFQNSEDYNNIING